MLTALALLESVAAPKPEASNVITVLCLGDSLTAGYGLSRVAVRFLKHLLWGVRATDSATFAAAAGILLLVAAIAAVTPSLRILRIDPARTLRDE